MNSSDSVHLDEHLARLLAAYDPELNGGDEKAPTIGVPRRDPGDSPGRLTAPDNGRLSFNLNAINEGSMGDVLPDSNRTAAYPDAPAPAVAFTPAPGTAPRIGRFELRRQLGKGGCGIVFLAFDPRLQREVALKIPRPEMLLSPDARRRLMREAHAAAEFDHPNLVPVYETGEIGPVCFIATAFCPGQTLAEWLERQAYPVPLRQAARLLATIAEAVQHAHDRGVLHRDVKPNNVILQGVKAEPADQEPPGACMLRGDLYIPRVVDFGLAKLSERGPSETASRQILGTPKYMAPEQAQGRHEDVGPAADVYALGVVLYEVIAGRAPYEAETDVEVLRLAIEGNLTLPRDVRRDIPRDLEAICLKALDRTPGKRYRTAIDLADDLRRFLDGKPTLARPLNFVGRAARFMRRNDQFVALGVVTLIAVFFLIIGSWKTVQTRKLQSNHDNTLREQAHRMVLDRQRGYARNVRDAFLSWRAGDVGQMAASLSVARTAAEIATEPTCFGLGYLAQLGRAERMSVACPAGPAVAVAVSPDGAWVATGHADGTVGMWYRATGTSAGAVKAHPDEVRGLAFLGRAALVSAGNAARTWTVGPMGELTPDRDLPGVPSGVACLAASPDGKRAFVAGQARDVLKWEADGTATWVTERGPVVAIAVSPDGKTVATATETGPVKLWNAATLRPEGELRAATGATNLAFAPSGTGWLLAVATTDGTIRLYDSVGREARALIGHPEPVSCLAVSDDGSTVASGAKDDCVCVWDVATGGLRTLLRGHEKQVRGVRFSPDGKALFTVSDDTNLKTWDLTADPEGVIARGLPPVVALAVHPDGQRHAVAYGDGSVEVFERRGGPPKRFAGERGPLAVIRFPKDGPPLGVELAGRSVVVWEFGEAARATMRADAQDGAVVSVADLSVEAGQVAIGDDRGRITVLGVGTGGPVASIDTRTAEPVRHLTFSPDGTMLAAPTTHQTVAVWLVGTTEPKFRVSGVADPWVLRFLPGGDAIATAGRGGSIRVWGLGPGRDPIALFGHVGRVTGLCVSPDGRTLASGSGTGDVKLWDLRTGEEMVSLRRHAGPVSVVEFTPDGKALFTGSTLVGGRGELAVWESGK